MVVSEIGEIWSPQTAPDRQAATVMTSMVLGESPNTATAIGIRMPNVPQEVPVANARPSAIRKKIAGMSMAIMDSPFTSEETKELILRLGRVRGLCVLTDSDAAGFRIRRYLNDLAQGFSVKNAYIPAVPGKEKRKAKPGKEGLLGVEGVPDEVIITALRRAGVNGQAPRTGRAIDYADLYELGLSGTPGAAGVRRRVLQRAGLPPRLSKKALCAALSSLYTYEEFRALCTAVEEEQEA